VTLATGHSRLFAVIGTDLSESKDVIETLSHNATGANQSTTETVGCSETAQASAHDARDDIDEMA